MKKAFTLIEMLVVIAIIVLLVLVFSPLAKTDKAVAAKNDANQKSIEKVMFLYTLENKNLPEGSIINPASLDATVVTAIKNKLTELGSGDAEGDYSAISTHFKKIDGAKLSKYGKNKTYYDNYFLIDSTSPKLAGYVFSTSILKTASGSAVQTIAPNELFVSESGTVELQGTIKEISTNRFGTLVIKTGGTLWAWGNNNTNGQLGAGAATDLTTPQQIGTDSDWKYVYTGPGASYAIKTNGRLYATGSNAKGQLGDNTTVPKTTFVPIGNDTDWKEVIASGDAAFALKTNGTLWAWGDNQYGQLGIGTIGGNHFTPEQVGVSNQWVKINMGYDMSYAIDSNGYLYAWGKNTSYQLGTNDALNKNTPTRIGLSGTGTWKDVDAGSFGAIAIQMDGTLWAWGSGSSGQLGDGTTGTYRIPTKIGNVSTWTQVESGRFSSYGIRDDGSLWIWGLNSSRQLGDGTITVANPMKQLGVDTDWKKLESSFDTFYAIKNNGDIYAAGSGTYYALGNNSQSNLFAITKMTYW